MMKTLTVITTTYNRAYCLHQVYESLLRQTSDDFIWMIIDDGSTDNTKEIVESWINANKIEIEYYFKENGGMHTARNLAYEKVHTEMNVIIDSDDWMTDDAVDKIVSFWKQFGDDKYYGIASNNISSQGSLVGTQMPDSIKACTMNDLFGKYHVKGDKKIILRSDLSRLYPFPEFEGEKFYPASYKYFYLDLKYQLLLMQECTCVVDYNPDSMTFDKFKQYKTCAKGFAHYRNAIIEITKSPMSNIKLAIHYIAESKFAQNEHFVRNCSKPIYAIIGYLPGCFMYYYYTHTKKKY